MHFPERINTPIHDRERNAHVRQRLQYLAERHGLALQIDEQRWTLKPDVEAILHRIGNVRQYRWLSRQHAATLKEQRTRIVTTLLADGEYVAGRVVGEGAINPYKNTRYFLLEQGKKVHFIEHTSTHELTMGQWLVVSHDKGRVSVRTVSED